MGAADIFGAADAPFTRYRAELQITGRLIGGIPKSLDMITGWIKSRLDMEDAALRELAIETQRQILADTGEVPSRDELVAAIAEATEGGNTFKFVDGSLVYEGRCMKAAIKEASNIAYPGVDWPGKAKMPKAFRKGLMSTVAERVFVVEDFISLGVERPSGTEQRVKHVKTPQGPRSAINVVDFVDKPLLVFHVDVLDDFLDRAAWGRIWQVIEQNGIGADRARGDGRSELVSWEVVV